MPRNQTKKKKKSLGAVTVSHFTLELFNAEVTEFNLATLLKPFALKWWEKESQWNWTKFQPRIHKGFGGAQQSAFTPSL